jgi:hypothetical protein
VADQHLRVDGAHRRGLPPCDPRGAHGGPAGCWRWRRRSGGTWPATCTTRWARP